MRIGELAGRAGTTAKTLRFYEQAGQAHGPPCRHVVALLARHAAELDARIAELEATRAEVQRLRERAAGPDPAACAADGVCHVITTG